MASTGMLILGNVCFAVRGTDFSMYPQHTIRLNHHLRADALLLMISALAFFSYPDYVATIMVCACICISICILSALLVMYITPYLWLFVAHGSSLVSSQ